MSLTRESTTQPAAFRRNHQRNRIETMTELLIAANYFSEEIK